MDWPREKSLSLIDEYEKREALWNPTNGYYYDKIKKHDLWVEIGQALDVTPTCAKKKIESLLSSFRREKAKGRKTIGTGSGKLYLHSRLHKIMKFK